MLALPYGGGGNTCAYVAGLRRGRRGPSRGSLVGAVGGSGRRRSRRRSGSSSPSTARREARSGRARSSRSTDDEIVEWWSAIARLEGALLRAGLGCGRRRGRPRRRPGGRVVCVLTGHGLKDSGRGRRADRLGMKLRVRRRRRPRTSAPASTARRSRSTSGTRSRSTEAATQPPDPAHIGDPGVRRLVASPEGLDLRVDRPDPARARARLERRDHRARARRGCAGRWTGASTRRSCCASARPRGSLRQPRRLPRRRRLPDLGRPDRADRGRDPAQPVAVVPEEKVETQGAACRAAGRDLARGRRVHRRARGAARRRTRARLCGALRGRVGRPAARALPAPSPLLDAVRADPPDGAVGATLSGSGPTVIVWARQDDVTSCAAELRARFPGVEVLPLQVAGSGAGEV